jgi:hypothetical protein
MRDLSSGPAALEQLRVQRARLADRMRPPWWHLTGSAILFALAFASPFGSRYLPSGVPTWPFLIPVLALALLLHWALIRSTGISVGIPDLSYRPGRPARIAMLIVSATALVAEYFLIDLGVLVGAVVVALLAVVAGVVSVQAAARGVRQHLREGAGSR